MIPTTDKLKHFWKKEPVLCTAMSLALLSMFFVPPSKDYWNYLDIRVLCLLFCLMTAVAGLQSAGTFARIAHIILLKVHTVRMLAFTLIMLCFFSSMLITNDVSLITFVPFTVLILCAAGKSDYLIITIVLQTIAANLGSMLTPIGNPQNLYLYELSGMNAGSFALILLPYTALSFLLLCISCLLIPSESIKEVSLSEFHHNAAKEMIYALLFLISICCVLHILSHYMMLAIVITVIFFTDRSLLKKADYGLLLTFISFFLFIGNMKHIPAVSNLLVSFIQGRTLLTGILVSQIISNVPAAILLSGFTDELSKLLIAVNIGGLGTLIASLASLISYKYYVNTNNSQDGHYMVTFTIFNAFFLICLSILAWVIC